MSKIESLSPINSSYTGIAKLNAHLTKITTAFQNTLSLDGSSPNALLANLDMNSFQIINLPGPTQASNAATKAYVDGLIASLSGASEFNTGIIYASAYGVGAAGNTPAENSAALVQAVNAAAGKKLKMPAGRVRYSGTTATPVAVIPSAGIRIEGMGKFNSICELDGTFYLFGSVDGGAIEIANIGFDGLVSQYQPWQQPFVFRGVQRLSVDGCWFTRTAGIGVIGTEGYHGTDAGGNGTRRSERIFIHNNLLEDIWGTVAMVTKYNGGANMLFVNNIIVDGPPTAISVESQDNLSYTTYNYTGEQVIVSGNLISNCSYLHSWNGSSYATNISYGISISENIKNLTVSNNIVVGTTGNTVAAGIALSTSPTQTDETVLSVNVCNNVVSGTTAVSGRGYNYQISVGDVNIEYFNLSNNTSYQGEVGFGFDTASGSKTLGTVRRFVCNGNVVSSPTEFGFWTQNVSSSGELPVTNGSFCNNSVSFAVSHGMSMFIKNCKVDGNHILGCGGAGINIHTGSSLSTVQNNNITGCGSYGITGDISRIKCDDNMIVDCAGSVLLATSIYATAGSGSTFNKNWCIASNESAAGIGSTNTRMAYSGFTCYPAGVPVTVAANAVGSTLGTDVVPIGKYGAVALEVGSDGTIDIVAAPGNAAGTYASAATARDALPAVQSGHIRFARVIVTCSAGDFTFGTTALNGAGVTATYISSVTLYGIRSAIAGNGAYDNNFVGLGVQGFYDTIANYNTGTYDTGRNRTA